MKKLLLASSFLACVSAAQAQTPGAQPEFCVTSPSQTADYNQLCISASSSGGAISIINHGSATGGLSIGVTSLTLANLIVTGSAIVPTRSPGDDSTHAASTAYVDAAVIVGSIAVNSTAIVGAAAGNILFTDGSVLKQSSSVALNNGGSLTINAVNALSLPLTDTLNASIAIGPGALAQISGMTSGAYGNIAIGYNALSGALIVSSTGLTAVGLEALAANTSGANNSAFGTQALQANTTAASNSAFGAFALEHATTGGANVAVGTVSLAANTTGSQNVAVGNQALNANIDGTQNVAIGNQAMIACLHSSLNVAIGPSAMGIGVCTATGSLNVAIGNGSLESNTDGQENTAVGSAVMAANTTGNFNAAVGVGAMTNNTTGGSNVAMGTNALFQGTTGSGNVALGGNAMGAGITTGSSNTAVGGSSLFVVTSGNNNTAAGAAALADVTTGGLNTAIGSSSGRGITTGSNNLILGSCQSMSAASSAVISVCTGGGQLHLDWNRTNANAWTIPGLVFVTGLGTTPGSKQPLCIDVSTKQIYEGTGGAC